MRKVKISPEVSGRCSGVCLGLLQGTVRVEESCAALRQELLSVCAHLHDRCKLEDIVKIPEIEDTRACYRALGKDAHRYRGSAEAMMRRAVREKGLYFINNVVEVNNIISLKSAFCLGTYDTAHLHGTLTLARRRAPSIRASARRNSILNFCPCSQMTPALLGIRQATACAP